MKNCFYLALQMVPLPHPLASYTEDVSSSLQDPKINQVTYPAGIYHARIFTQVTRSHALDAWKLRKRLSEILAEMDSKKKTHKNKRSLHAIYTGRKTCNSSRALNISVNSSIGVYMGQHYYYYYFFLHFK